MSFRFEPAESSPPWHRPRYVQFLDALADQFPNRQEMTRQAVQLAVTKPGRPPKVTQLVENVQAMRALSDDGLQAVQLMPDQLVVNFLRGDKPYPGFDVLLERATDLQRRYQECYSPVGITEVALHYIDLVSIPVDESRVVYTEKYVTIDFHAPVAHFGNFSTFDLRAVVHPPPEKLPVQVVFSLEPGGPEDTHRRYRLEWHSQTRGDPVMSDADVRTHLRAAHDRLWKCFQSAFTPDGWALFQPEES